MTTLKQFPLVAAGFHHIMMDQPRARTEQSIRMDATVEEHWHAKFVFAEAGLTRLFGRTIGEVMPLLRELPGYEDIRQTDSALEFVYLPVDDSDSWLLDAAGCRVMEYASIKEVFESFFEGELRDVFEERKIRRR